MDPFAVGTPSEIREQLKVFFSFSINLKLALSHLKILRSSLTVVVIIC